MNPCDDSQAALLFDDERTYRDHAQSCARCRDAEDSIRSIDRLLTKERAPTPSPQTWAAIESQVDPILRRRARAQEKIPSMATALGAALLPLPVLIPLSLMALWVLHDLLSRILPAAVSGVLVAGQVILLALLLSLTYASVPFLADRQRRALLEEPT